MQRAAEYGNRMAPAKTELLFAQWPLQGASFGAWPCNSAADMRVSNAAFALWHSSISIYGLRSIEEAIHCAVALEALVGAKQ